MSANRWKEALEGPALRDLSGLPPQVGTHLHLSGADLSNLTLPEAPSLEISKCLLDGTVVSSKYAEFEDCDLRKVVWSASVKHLLLKRCKIKDLPKLASLKIQDSNLAEVKVPETKDLRFIGCEMKGVTFPVAVVRLNLHSCKLSDVKLPAAKSLLVSGCEVDGSSTSLSENLVKMLAMGATLCSFTRPEVTAQAVLLAREDKCHVESKV